MATPSPLSLANVDSPRQLALNKDVRAVLDVKVESVDGLWITKNCLSTKAKDGEGQRLLLHLVRPNLGPEDS